MSRFLGEEKLPKLLYRGAEAEIHLEKWYGELAVRKNRLPKAYRVPDLDSSIRRTRMLHETNLMHEARKLGIPVPVVQTLNVEESWFVMEFINGSTLKDEMNAVAPQVRRKKCVELGKLVAMLHEGGLVHGDLTISNVISAGSKLYLIDFGLGNLSTELEDRGVDLLLLNRAIKSTHVRFHEEAFRSFLKGYAAIMGKKLGVETVEKMHQIERRGRYFERG